MTDMRRPKVAILFPGDAYTRQTATAENNRFSEVFKSLKDVAIDPEAAVYNDDFCAEVKEQLLKLDGVLVWHNPIEGGRDRSVLDAMLSELALADVFVTTHPDLILKMGTKEVVYQTRHLPWGCETYLYRNLAELRKSLPLRLYKGEVRVLKQNRGHSGIGIWKVELADKSKTLKSPDELSPDTLLRVRHAMRGSVEEILPFEDFVNRCEPYFSGQGKMIDQIYQVRLPEGMVRCYLVQDKVAGFGHQAINALYPKAEGSVPEDAPQPGPRLYHPATLSEFQRLKQILETQWLPAMQEILGIASPDLPLLWDADFMFGPKSAEGEDTYVLCEINVSSVFPFPDSALPVLAQAVLKRLV